MPNQIVPIIMTDAVSDIEQKLGQLRAWQVNRVVIDILDGVFADNITIGVDDLREIDFEQTTLELQLMVEEPVDYLGEIHNLKAKQKRVYGHIERMGNLDEFIDLGRELGVEVGWALDLYTPLDDLQPEHLLKADGILLMSVKAGFSGQVFNSLVLDKIKSLRAMGFSQDIEVDGGINNTTIPLCLDAGANLLAVNSAIWQTDNPEQAYYRLKAMVGN
jgi:ribulose-phosphate 3-epimerase